VNLDAPYLCRRTAGNEFNPMERMNVGVGSQSAPVLVLKGQNNEGGVGYRIVSQLKFRHLVEARRAHYIVAC
jgi:hypothetical protein